MPWMKTAALLLWIAVTATGNLGGAYAGEYEAAAIAHGGRLYDDWAKELGAMELHRIESSREKPIPRPKRCVQCHGWDYRGKNGSAAKAGPSGLVKGMETVRGRDPGSIAQVLLDSTHAYGDFLTATERADLALFLSKGQLAMDELIDAAAGRAKGNPLNGQVFFQTVCANCHGNDGQQIAEIHPLGDTARNNPWQALHTLLNGHPGGTMPALRVLDRVLVVDALAFVQTLPARDILASVVRGGRLYDTWYKENGRSVPPGVHPAYPQPLPKSIDARTTWRCKECHGWDYRGRDGAYGSDTEHKTGIAGIQAMAGADPAVITAKFLNTQHGYSKFLSPRDVADLANFVSRGQLDMDSIIDRKTLKARGDSVAYASYYQTICATCHGETGIEVRTMPPLGRIAATDPWRALHGILNGHAGEPMPPLIALPRKAASGILAFTQTLPQHK